MNPITSATISGIGQTLIGVEGTWVVGFFTDSDDAQMPMINYGYTYYNRCLPKTFTECTI